MDTLKCIYTRRSIRRYDSRKVDVETMLTIVEAGTHAPSTGNLQDWKFILVEDKEVMKKLSETSVGQECVQNAAFVVVICSDPAQTERYYGLRGTRLYTIQNCAAAAQNMLLAAHSKGLGGAWVGSFDEDKVRTILSIPGSARPQAIVSFGYPAEKPDHKMVKDLSTVTYFNSYGTTLRHPHRVLKDYSRDVEKITAKLKSNVSNTSGSTSSRLKDIGQKLKAQSKALMGKYKRK